MYRIFIVEDDKTIAQTLMSHLKKWDYEVQCAEDFKNIRGEFEDFGADLILLDIGLPFFDGFYWCTEIRKVSTVPILFISSADDKMNIVMAMSIGGDEFIEKPFDLNVLTAKVQAILRRTYSFAGMSNIIEYKGISLDLGDAAFTCQGKKTELTKNEFKILQMLLENKGKIVSRDDIMERLWESDEFIDDNTLTVNVARLRKKLSLAGHADMILTKKGIGYMVKA